MNNLLSSMTGGTAIIPTGFQTSRSRLMDGGLLPPDSVL